MLKTSKEDITALEAEKTKISKDYTKTVIERNRIMDDYDKNASSNG